VIQLDIDPNELGRNYPNAASILGDAKVSLRRMIDAAPKMSPERGDWNGRVQQIVAEWRAANAPMRDSDATPIRPERICREISDVLPADGVVVSDTGHAGIWTARFIELKHPGHSYYRTGIARWGFRRRWRESRCRAAVVCFTGDGGLLPHRRTGDGAAPQHQCGDLVTTARSTRRST
jgi:acetolactate synthase-1/2/3 large subunit